MKRTVAARLSRTGGVLWALGVATLLPLVAQAHEGGARAQTPQVQQLLAHAVAYEHGEGVARDTTRAAAIYCEVARLGDPEGMYGLGWMYANGRGLPRNDGYAATLFAMAAKLGHEHAARMTRYTGGTPGDAPDCLRSRHHLQYASLRDVEHFVATLAPERRRIARLVADLAPEYGVNPRLALAVALAESALDPQARSPKDARGVMQLIPATAERFEVADTWDPEQNIRGGLRYLRWLLAYFRGDVSLAVAGYNAGEGAVDRHRGVPPYRETRRYVDRVIGFAQQRDHPYDGEIVAPSPIVPGPPLAQQKALGP